MKRFLAACLGVVFVTGCITERDASYAPGGAKTIVPFPINVWQAPVIVANHLFYDRPSGVIFDIHITAIDGKPFQENGQRTKYYFQINPGPHVIAVSSMMAKVKWVADFDFLIEPGDTVEITGELTTEGLVLWFADVNTGKPVTAKVLAVDERKRDGAAAADPP